MVIPQKVENDSKLVTITIGNVNYVYKNAVTFEENTQHNFEISVSKTGISVNVTIGPWEDDTADNNGVAEEEEIDGSNKITYEAPAQLNINANSFGATITSHNFDGYSGTILFNKEITTVGSSAFMLGQTIYTVTLPNSIKIIESDAFYASGLNHLAFPEKLESIKDSAFEECSLVNITLPSTVSEIGDKAFYNNNTYTSVKCYATTPPSLGDDVFDSIDGGMTLKVPEESISLYEASDWKTYFTTITKIE